MKRFALAACACAALALPTAAHAQEDAWTQQVRAILAETGKVFEDQGYRATHHLLTGSLDNEGDEMVEVTLEGGKEYQIMGACDEDCSDLDLAIFDAAGRQVDIDVEDDDFPIVTVRVAQNATYRMKVGMAACSAEPCRYGIGVFGK